MRNAAQTSLVAGPWSRAIILARCIAEAESAADSVEAFLEHQMWAVQGGRRCDAARGGGVGRSVRRMSCLRLSLWRTLCNGWIRCASAYAGRLTEGARLNVAAAEVLRQSPRSATPAAV